MRFKISADTTRESMHVSVSNTTLEVKQYSEFMKDIADQDTWDQSQSHKVMNTTVTVDAKQMCNSQHGKRSFVIIKIICLLSFLK
ncbi:hypothetical protein B9Z55_000271 [Caenorhabditis nigoni]|uniref:Uncharacterized protein n=1 Tax=Caenorhabditis nigoni TaxID=1611254 RepID=A0A2G5VLS3_9PELO|nr:hypothetical protein B9Z55_000271 [Caenorhabditis nigoni]